LQVLAHCEGYEGEFTEFPYRFAAADFEAIRSRLVAAVEVATDMPVVRERRGPVRRARRRGILGIPGVAMPRQGIE